MLPTEELQNKMLAYPGSGLPFSRVNSKTEKLLIVKKH
jgi:hypothetical protein